MKRFNTRTTYLLASSLLLGSLSFTAAAAEKRPASIFLTTGHYNFDTDTQLKDSTPATIGFGYDIKRIGIEFSYTEISAETQAEVGDIDVSHLLVDSLFYVTDNNWRPYFVAGLGARDAKFGNDDSTNPFVNFGLGVKGNLSSRFQLRGDIRGIHDLEDSFTDSALNLGIAFLFGKPRGYSPSRAKAAPAAVAAAAAPSDSDNDGVINSQDRCPNSAAGASVDALGCERDSDKDGVSDSLDQCPDTAGHFKVDEKGCPISLSETVSVDLNIQFDNNSDVVKEAYMGRIEDVAKFMASYTGTQVAVEGYTDDRGSESYNQQLSQRRADSVRQVLIDRFGIAGSRITATGYGEANPIATNDTAEGRATNRRVVANMSSTVETNATK